MEFYPSTLYTEYIFTYQLMDNFSVIDVNGVSTSHFTNHHTNWIGHIFTLQYIKVTSYHGLSKYVNSSQK